MFYWVALLCCYYLVHRYSCDSAIFLEDFFNVNFNHLKGVEVSNKNSKHYWTIRQCIISFWLLAQPSMLITGQWLIGCWWWYYWDITNTDINDTVPAVDSLRVLAAGLVTNFTQRHSETFTEDLVRVWRSSDILSNCSRMLYYWCLVPDCGQCAAQCSVASVTPASDTRAVEHRSCTYNSVQTAS